MWVVSYKETRGILWFVWVCFAFLEVRRQKILLERGKFSFLYVDIWFDVMKYKCIVKNNSFEMLVVFSPTFMADTKITFVYNFVALLNFLELFIIGKYIKIRFKNRGSPCYFLSSRSQKINNITKIEQKRLCLCRFFVSSFMAFLVKKPISTINMWFNFVFGSFFELEHLINLFISGVYAKRWPK